MRSPRSEWLDAIATGQMQYHRSETVETTLSAEGTLPVLTARTLTDATIWGSRAIWRLTLRSWFEPRGDEWVVSTHSRIHLVQSHYPISNRKKESS